LFVLLQNAREVPQRGVIQERRVEFGRRHADFAAQLVHLAFAIDNWKSFARIPIQNAPRVSTVHSQHACPLEPGPSR
jgi:hypothetical protein